MNQSSLPSDEDDDSLFGSPPPCPARGRSPSSETSIAGEQVGPTIPVPSTGAGRKNVGTIALPGSHMSCAELPADLPASGSTFPRLPSSHDSRSSPTSVHTSVATSRTSTRVAPSRASSASSLPSASAPARKRRSKAKSAASASPAPPITLPGPNEPTPPNFLRSQSSLLGLAGLVGCVKPAQLHAHTPPASTAQPSQPHLPVRGSTPTHPIVLDDDQDTPHIGKHPRDEPQVLRRLDQLNPGMLRANIVNSLAKEKNIFPVLESLIKLLGGEPRVSSPNPTSQPFARPYGHGIFRLQSPAPVAPAPSSKRRKLKHVPAGAADWDVPFPFAAGEGPEAYRDTWAQERSKQLVTQLLELVQNATKRAAIKTAKSGGRNPEGRIGLQMTQTSRDLSLRTQIMEPSPTQANVREPVSCADVSLKSVMNETTSNVMSAEDLELDPIVNSTKGKVPINSEGTVEQGESDHYDYAAFEEWLSQLQSIPPLETQMPTLNSVPSIPSPGPLDLIQPDASTASYTTLDKAIDPTLLAISRQAGSLSRSQSPTSPFTLIPGDIPQLSEVSCTPPVLTQSPRTSLSSVTEPPTPHSDFADMPASMTAHQDFVRDILDHPPIDKGHQAPSLADTSGSSHMSTVQKGKARADGRTGFDTSTPNRPTPSATVTSKGGLDKQAILARARERREQLVSEIERAKMEIWQTSIEHALLAHLAKDGS